MEFLFQCEFAPQGCYMRSCVLFSAVLGIAARVSDTAVGFIWRVMEMGSSELRFCS